MKDNLRNGAAIVAILSAVVVVSVYAIRYERLLHEVEDLKSENQELKDEVESIRTQNTSNEHSLDCSLTEEQLEELRSQKIALESELKELHGGETPEICDDSAAANDLQTLGKSREEVSNLNRQLESAKTENQELLGQIARLEATIDSASYSDSERVIAKDQVSITIESVVVSDYGQQVNARLVVSNDKSVPVSLMFDAAEKIVVTDYAGNQIKLDQHTGIYECRYGLRGQQYCESYLSRAPVIDPGSKQSVILRGKADDRDEAPLSKTAFDLNGKFLVFEPTKKLLVIPAQFPGIPLDAL